MKKLGSTIRNYSFRSPLPLGVILKISIPIRTMTVMSFQRQHSYYFISYTEDIDQRVIATIIDIQARTKYYHGGPKFLNMKI